MPTPSPSRGLTKRYGDRVAVDHLDIEVPSGVVAGFVGPNGAGKTTTMAMLLGLVRPTAGTGTVLGASIDEPAAYLHEVGALIESPAFYPSLTGAENLRMFATVGRHDTASIPALLDEVGLGDRGDDRYRSYSLGMKQRLGIAAALLGDPKLLILDEPANGLDPQGVREMRSPRRRSRRHGTHGARVLARPERARAGVRLARAHRHRPVAVPGADAPAARRRRARRRRRAAARRGPAGAAVGAAWSAGIRARRRRRSSRRGGRRATTSPRWPRRSTAPRSTPGSCWSS